LHAVCSLKIPNAIWWFSNSNNDNLLQKCEECCVSELKRNFGKRLRYLRRNRDFTQEKLAELVGRSVNFISLLENGDTAPSFATIEKLATALNVEVADLFRFDSNIE
jgi:DNA-binding XRE family transcriptional regulator